MYYSKPVFGRAYKPFSTSMVSVNAETADQWFYKRLVMWRRQEYALFRNNKGEEIMQSLRAIRFVRCKPGEDNIMSKLSNVQSIAIYQRANKGEPHAALAVEFGVSEGTISAIKNLRARASVTLQFLNGTTKKAIAAAAVVATRNKGKKLSPSIASFIRKDRDVNRLSVKQIAIKYCVSERTIQRIVKGEMYSVPTLPKPALIPVRV
jgi:hypothetical protein